MSDQDVLSQEEIDALLTSVGEESGADIPGLDDVYASGEVEVVNFSSQERVVRGELPVLEKIYERAVTLFANDIYQLMAKELVIRQDPIVPIKHREFLPSLPNPTLISIFRIKPLRGKALVIFDSTLIYNLVDYYFGGNTQFLAQKERVDFTAAELRVQDILVSKFVHNIEQAWSSVSKIDTLKIGRETNPQLIHIGEPDDLLLVSRFSIDFGKETGHFSFVLPYLMVEPIKLQLEMGVTRSDEENDPNWIKSLKRELLEVELNVTALTHEITTTLGDVMRWKVDDFIPIDDDAVIRLFVQGIPKYTGKLGRAGENAAVKIVEHLKY